MTKETKTHTNGIGTYKFTAYLFGDTENIIKHYECLRYKRNEITVFPISGMVYKVRVTKS